MQQISIGCLVCLERGKMSIEDILTYKLPDSDLLTITVKTAREKEQQIRMNTVVIDKQCKDIDCKNKRIAYLEYKIRSLEAQKTIHLDWSA